MFQTEEIRWFFSSKSHSIERWFHRNGQSIERAETRVDFYLPLPKIETLNIKLREGKIEVKQRSTQRWARFDTDVEGYFETWGKWGFVLSEKDVLADAIVHKRQLGWLAVEKSRIGVKVGNAQGQHVGVFKMTDFLPFGCQIDYSRIVIKSRTYFTFGLEWFGTPNCGWDQDLLSEILGTQKLECNNSMSYAAFLCSLGED